MTEKELKQIFKEKKKLELYEFIKKIYDMEGVS